MAPTELEADCYRDVTIYLVKKLSTDEQAGSSSNKRRRTHDMQAPESHGVTTLGQVTAKASRLRECSTYFEACMSERWAQPEIHFHLEAETEVCYYEDCFSRMHSLFKPIPSVPYCIELLKIASQIGFQDVIDIGLKFLASAPWTHEEENLVRHFCRSYLVPFRSLTELTARLPQEAKSSSFAKNLLTRCLQNAIPGIIEESSMVETEKECGSDYSRCQKFEGVFHLVVSGAEPASVVKHALDLLKQASLGLLSALKRKYCGIHFPENGPVRTYQWIMSSFCWLFKTARKANSAQTVVELLLDDNEASDVVLHVGSNGTEWAQMMYSIFQGVLKGDLFLTSSQRMKLFKEWRWILSADVLTRDDAMDASFMTRFISTFPQQQQEDFWMGVEFGTQCGPSFKAYTTWVSSVLNGEARRHQELTASSEEDRGQD